MHQTRKGNQWYFGLKAHIGVDSKEGVVHSVCTSAASVADKQMLPDLLHGEERKVWGDGGYQGQTDSIHQAAPHAQDMPVAGRSSKHVFRLLKRVFGFDKVRYRGIAKNHNRLCARFALVNLYLHANAGPRSGRSAFIGCALRLSASGTCLISAIVIQPYEPFS
jgi:IS5 family transposase